MAFKLNINRFNLLRLSTSIGSARPSLLNSAKKFSSDPNDNDFPVSDMENPYEREKEVCILCKNQITPNYKNVRLLSQFQSPYTGRIYGRHITGLCSKKQEQVENEIIKSQSAGLMPYYHKNEAYLHDPKLFDPENPIRPHRF